MISHSIPVPELPVVSYEDHDHFLVTQARLKRVFQRARDPRVQNAWQYAKSFMHEPRTLASLAFIAEKLDQRFETERILNQDMKSEHAGKALADFLRITHKEPALGKELVGREQAFVHLGAQLVYALRVYRATQPEGDATVFLRAALKHPLAFELFCQIFTPKDIARMAQKSPEGFESLLAAETRQWDFRRDRMMQGITDPSADVGQCFLEDRFGAILNAQSYAGQKPAMRLEEIAALAPELLWELNISRKDLIEVSPLLEDNWDEAETDVETLIEAQQREAYQKLTPFGEAVLADIERIREKGRRQSLARMAQIIREENGCSAEDETAIKQRLLDRIGTETQAVHCLEVVQTVQRKTPHPTTKESRACWQALPVLLMEATPVMQEAMALLPHRVPAVAAPLLENFRHLPPSPNLPEEMEQRRRAAERHVQAALYYADGYAALHQSIPQPLLAAMIEHNESKLEKILIAEQTWQDTQHERRLKTQPNTLLCLQDHFNQAMQKRGGKPVTMEQMVKLPEDTLLNLLMHVATLDDGRENQIFQETLRRAIKLLPDIEPQKKGATRFSS